MANEIENIGAPVRDRLLTLSKRNGQSFDLVITRFAQQRLLFRPAINTDADQILIAETGPHPHSALPPIIYVSGGLQNAGIRKMACDSLGSGEAVFHERARHLPGRLDR